MKGDEQVPAAEGPAVFYDLHQVQTDMHCKKCICLYDHTDSFMLNCCLM